MTTNSSHSSSAHRLAPARMLLWVSVLALPASLLTAAQTYPLVGTGQTRCYDDTKEIRCPVVAQPFYGQDAQHPAYTPAYRDNRDGTVTDLNTQLINNYVRLLRGPSG
jgi:hypothetical protein